MLQESYAHKVTLKKDTGKKKKKTEPNPVSITLTNWHAYKILWNGTPFALVNTYYYAEGWHMHAYMRMHIVHRLPVSQFQKHAWLAARRYTCRVVASLLVCESVCVFVCVCVLSSIS